MTGDDIDARSTADPAEADALNSTEPVWRDDRADEVDAERTIDADADLIEHVRATTRAARVGLATPPAPPAGDARPTTPVDPPPTSTPPPSAETDPPPAGTDPSPPVPSAEVGRPPAGIDLSLPLPPAGVPTPAPAATGPALPPPTPDGPRFATARAVRAGDAGRPGRRARHAGDPDPSCRADRLGDPGHRRPVAAAGAPAAHRSARRRAADRRPDA